MCVIFVRSAFSSFLSLYFILLRILLLVLHFPNGNLKYCNSYRPLLLSVLPDNLYVISAERSFRFEYLVLATPNNLFLSLPFSACVSYRFFQKQVASAIWNFFPSIFLSFLLGSYSLLNWGDRAPVYVLSYSCSKSCVWNVFGFYIFLTLLYLAIFDSHMLAGWLAGGFEKRAPFYWGAHAGDAARPAANVA